jgi:hypothetical protein
MQLVKNHNGKAKSTSDIILGPRKCKHKKQQHQAERRKKQFVRDISELFLCFVDFFNAPYPKDNNLLAQSNRKIVVVSSLNTKCHLVASCRRVQKQKGSSVCSFCFL